MAHELDRNAVTGVANMFSVRVSPWHKEGHLLTSAPTLDDALTMCDMRYVVEKRPVTYSHGDTTRESAMAFLTVRTDTGAELGAVGPQYKVVQTADAMIATLSPLLDTGVLSLETGGVLRKGADAWLLGKWALDKFGPEAREVLGDEVQPYALVKVNHSGRRNNEIALTLIRGVCANTLGMIETEIDGGHVGTNANGDTESAGRTTATGVRHTGDALERMRAAAEKLFGGMVKRCELVATQYRAMKETELTPTQFRALVQVPALGVHPTRRRGWNPEAKQADSVVERYEKKGAEIVRLWTEGAGHTGDGSAWEAYNGLVEAVDHDTNLFPQRTGVYRTAQLMHSNLRDMKDAAVHEIVEYCETTRAAIANNETDKLADILAATEARGRLATAV